VTYFGAEPVDPVALRFPPTAVVLVISSTSVAGSVSSPGSSDALSGSAWLGRYWKADKYQCGEMHMVRSKTRTVEISSRAARSSSSKAAILWSFVGFLRAPLA